VNWLENVVVVDPMTMLQDGVFRHLEEDKHEDEDKGGGS
jgi:hypothetical protein